MDGNIGTKKNAKHSKITKTVVLVVMAIILIAVVAGNVVCGVFSEMITTYFGGFGLDTSNIDYASSQAACEAIEAEGAVLVKNENDALPLKDVKKINVFGWSSISPSYSGGGSGSSNSLSLAKDFFAGFENAGFEYNKKLETFYRNYKAKRGDFSWSKSYPYLDLIEPDASEVEKEIEDAKAFSNVAVVVISRFGGEHQDIPKTQVKWNKAEDKTRTYLDATKEEEDLLKLLGKNFDKVIVIVNSTNSMNLGFVAAKEVDAALVVGAMGQYGSYSVGKILKGEITPSGKLADTAAYDLSTAATYATSPDGMNADTEKGSVRIYKGTTADYYVDYLENIYVGYKWYETADSAGFWSSDYALNKWGVKKYEDVVQYPFGYGLSYTDFEWKVKSVSPASGAEITSATEITVNVSVKNVGSEKGKETVQLYYEPPYTTGGIEKASKNLCAFIKTVELAPGKEETLTLKFSAGDMKSYDCYDRNNNGFCGYELEKGEYKIYVSTDAHNAANIEKSQITYTVAESEKIGKDAVTEKAVINRFTGNEAVDNGISVDGSTTEGEIYYMTRADFVDSFPTVSTESRSKKVVMARNEYAHLDKHYAGVEKLPQTADVGLRLYENGELNKELINELGKDYNASVWDDLLSQISEKELIAIVEGGGYGTAEIKSVGKEKFIDIDGPQGLNDTNMTSGGKTNFTFFPSETVLAQTWNTVLSFGYGQTIGNEAKEAGVSGWYAPGANIHRSPFGGRNFEYYSEDAYLSGKMAANTIAGATSKGLYCYLKHFAVNETANNGSGASVGMYTWLTEQAMREVYLKGFEIAVKEGPANAVMAAYNFIGASWCGGSYALMTNVLREEWGFNGTVVTDYSDGSVNSDPDQGLRAGTDIWLAGAHAGLGEFNDKKSDIALNCMRRAAKNVLYTYCNTLYRQSTFDPTSVTHRGAANVAKTWVWLLVAVDILVVAMSGVWVYFVFFKGKKEKSQEAA